MLVRASDRGAFARKVCLELLGGVLPVLLLLALRWLVDAVLQSHGAQEAWLLALLVVVALFLANRIVQALSRVENDILGQHVVDHVSGLVQEQAARLDMAFFDTPAYHDSFHRAQQEGAARPMQVMSGAMQVVSATVAGLGVLILLAFHSIVSVLLLMVAVIPTFVVRLRKARAIYTFRRNETQTMRRAAYYNQLLTSKESAAELRVYGLAGRLRSLYVEVRRALAGRVVQIAKHLGLADVGSAVVEAAALMAVVWILATRTAAGGLTLGAFVMLFEAFRRGQGYLNTLASGMAGLYDNGLFVSNLFEFLRLEPTVVSPTEPAELPSEVQSLELRDVCFRYPDMDHDVLHHYNLRAERGKVVRLEGENGYGKSTVVKLLLRLYDPQAGAVLLNGLDVRLFDLTAYRRLMGVLFQDFVRYQCTLEENIRMGGWWRKETIRPKWLQKSVDTDGQTMLGRMFDGGMELSMGQWQRVALARALQSDAPVLLLDEPLAWIDAAGRKEIVEQIEQLKENKIIILISHC